MPASIASIAGTAQAKISWKNATITAGSNVAYSWDLGDGTSGSGAMLTHTYAAAGVYTAVVTASNSIRGAARRRVKVAITRSANRLPRIKGSSRAKGPAGETSTII